MNSTKTAVILIGCTLVLVAYLAWKKYSEKAA